jgi:hypothetical protein
MSSKIKSIFRKLKLCGLPKLNRLPRFFKKWYDKYNKLNEYEPLSEIIKKSNDAMRDYFHEYEKLPKKSNQSNQIIQSIPTTVDNSTCSEHQNNIFIFLLNIILIMLLILLLPLFLFYLYVIIPLRSIIPRVIHSSTT